jgi:thiamine pyrophosphate-dependent acetolactate synthase large subunit-like protein
MVSASRPTREDYYRALADSLPAETLVVTALGNASYLWATVRDAPENFYLEDAMGLALPLALGLAVAQPDRKVVVVEGDGGLLMHMGGLVTVGAVAPKNLTILLIQNGVHAASGGQALTNADLDFADLGRAMGMKHAENIGSVDAFQSALVSAIESDGPSLLALATEPDLDAVTPPVMLDPVATKRRFVEAVGAPRYVSIFFGGGKLVEP